MASIFWNDKVTMHSRQIGNCSIAKSRNRRRIYTEDRFHATKKTCNDAVTGKLSTFNPAILA